jgi:hypothetical protein
MVSNQVSYFKTITLSSNICFKPWTLFAKPWSWFVKPWTWYAQNYMRSVPVVLFLAQETWTSTLGRGFFWCGGGLQEECNSGSYWLCHSEGHVIWHFLIIHGGLFGYKMFSILRARQNACTTTSFRTRRLPAPRHTACANNNIIPLRI